MFQSIIVAVDGSDPSMRAVDAACALARAFGSEVHLVHARERGDAPDDVLDAARSRAAKAGVEPASATCLEGDPFEEIMTIVGLYGADLVVTGRRGLGNLGGLIAGSVSQRIAKSADCAHLSVK